MDRSISVGGAMIYWRITDFYDRDKLLAGFQALSLTAVPRDSTREANLKYALQECFKGADTMIRPKQKGFAIVKEIRAEQGQRNSYIELYGFWLEVHSDNTATLKMDPFDQGVADKVVGVFNKYFGLITGDAVTDALVAVVNSLHGETLREKGGLYWVTAGNAGLFRSLRDVLHTASTSGKSTIYIVSHDLNPDAVMAVKDAFLENIDAEMLALNQAINDPDLGERALQGRQNAANALLDKAELYESILGQGLEVLKDQLTSLAHAAAMAKFRVAAAKRGGGSNGQS